MTMSSVIRFISVLVLNMWITDHTCTAKNILFLPVIGEGSHYSTMASIAGVLVRRNHTVTMLLSRIFEKKLTSCNQQGCPFIFEFFEPNITKSELEGMLKNMTNAGLRGEYLTWLVEMLGTDYMERQVSECHNILGDKQLLQKLQTSNYDLAIVDTGVQCPVMQYLRKHIGLPYVAFSPLLSIPGAVLLENRTPFNPAYMPEMTTGFDHSMTLFTDRLTNTAHSIFLYSLLSAFFNPFGKFKNIFDIADASLHFVDAELWLINTHFSLDFPRPLLPNTIPVGGITTLPAEPLDREWVEFLQSAGDDGVVLFSMGTYASGIDEDVAAMFAGAFAQLPQKVIWKLNGKPSTTLTPGVKVVDWIPQNDLLAHPQIKAFVYHCGLNGIWEAVYHGVPMVAVPLFGDQYDNAQRIVSRGMGVEVNIATLTSDELAEAIRTVINDPSFKKNAARMSGIFRDTPRKPTELAADWMEYVIRHDGAKHLRSAALDLNILQYLLIDVILAMSLGLIALVIMGICFCSLSIRGCRKVCGSYGKVKRE